MFYSIEIIAPPACLILCHREHIEIESDKIAIRADDAFTVYSWKNISIFYYHPPTKRVIKKRFVAGLCSLGSSPVYLMVQCHYDEPITDPRVVRHQTAMCTFITQGHSTYPICKIAVMHLNPAGRQTGYDFLAGQQKISSTSWQF